MEFRKQFNELFFGTNGTGKTTAMLDLALKYLEQPVNENKKLLMLMPDFSESKYDGVPEVTISDIEDKDFQIGKIMCMNVKRGTKTIYQEIYERFAMKGRQFNGLIINDDMSGTFNRRPEDILTLNSRKRQMNIDMFWNFHGLKTDCPPSFFKSVSGITLFKTEDIYNDTMNKIAMNKRKHFEQVYFEVQAISNGIMLDINGYETDNKNEAVHNKEKILNPYYNKRVA